MKEDEYDDFSDLTPVSTPLESDEIRRMMMAFVVVPARLVKLKRLVGTLYRKGGNNV
jgi:hypothetical protein